MKTPIVDFLEGYAASNVVRFHMPGHKGEKLLGPETYDITEIDGADSLFEAAGIIAESERNASSLFGAESFYSVEGSSLAIRAMLYLALLAGRECGARPIIVAARNVHKSFVTAAALLDLDIAWVYSDSATSYLSCRISPESLERSLATLGEKPSAVYVTTPDYLGATLDVAGLSRVAHRHGIPLLVDNAHGAYLKFLPQSLHPIDLGADACCDSAHKTLPALTGCAYLHVSKNAPRAFAKRAKAALAAFGSTSPSYLLLASLDKLNALLDGNAYREQLANFVNKACHLKSELAAHGYETFGDEPLKLTLAPHSYGYTGRELAQILKEHGIVPEFYDNDFVVLMLGVGQGAALPLLRSVLLSLPRRAPQVVAPPSLGAPRRTMSPREALFAPSERIAAKTAAGRTLSAPSLSCPPAVPLVVSGEEISAEAVACFEYYGIEHVDVVIE